MAGRPQLILAGLSDSMMKCKKTEGCQYPVLYLDQQDLKALLLMVEGNLHPIGMPPSRSSPGGQNTPAERQKLASDIFNLIQ